MTIFSMSLAATFIILAVMVVRALFIHKLPKKTFMALWGIVACRLLIPLSVPSQLNILSILDSLRASLQKEAFSSATAPFSRVVNDAVAIAIPERVTETVVSGMTPVAFSSGAAATANTTNLPWFFYLWLVGACVFALYFLINHWRCKNIYKTSVPVENHFIENWLHAHPLRRRIYVKQSDNITAPLTYGIVKPVILLPASTDWQDKTGLTYILTHEYVHIQRFDTLLKWILVALLSLHWFNPFVWFMYILANRDIELSCDEKVVRAHGEKIKSGYALMLIGLEEKRGRFMSLCSNFSKNSVEERVVSIMKTNKNSFSSRFAAFLLITVVILVFATTKAATAVMAEIPNEYNGHMERMLFVTKGETALKVTYDGSTWEYYPCINEGEEWKWYSPEEFESLINLAKADNYSTYRWAGAYEAENDLTKLEQTLADINNGIKVSKSKIIFVADDIGPQSVSSSTMRCFYWYCFGYSFTDKAGNTVDLGLFETRSALFAALKLYYDKEVIAGHLSQSEADRLFNKIAHPLRNHDEVSLLDKFINVNWSSVVLPTHGEGSDKML